MTKFPWKLKYMAKYILKAFFLTTFPLTRKKCPKIYAATLVLPLNGFRKIQATKSLRYLRLIFIIFFIDIFIYSKILRNALISMKLNTKI